MPKKKEIAYTKLEKLVFDHPKMWALPADTDLITRQAVLNIITPEIMKMLSPGDIVDHVAEIYDATMPKYSTDLAHAGKLEFFARKISGTKDVLVLGCARGSEVLLLSRFQDCRRVMGVDISPRMLNAARARKKKLFPKKGWPKFRRANMHNFNREFLKIKPGFTFDAVWAYHSLFLHTPASFIYNAFESVAQVVRTGAIFAMTYINGQLAPGGYDNLRFWAPAAASAAGTKERIQYFSQPHPGYIKIVAESCGFRLDTEIPSKKDICQLFRKMG